MRSAVVVSRGSRIFVAIDLVGRHLLSVFEAEADQEEWKLLHQKDFRFGSTSFDTFPINVTNKYVCCYFEDKVFSDGKRYTLMVDTETIFDKGKIHNLHHMLFQG